MREFTKLNIYYILKLIFSLPTTYLCREMRSIFYRDYILPTALLLLTSVGNSQSGWGPDQRLVFLPGGGWYPRAACCGDTIHLVWWQAYAPGYDEVFYKRSTDAGEAWGPDVLLSAVTFCKQVRGCYIDKRIKL